MKVWRLLEEGGMGEVKINKPSMPSIEHSYRHIHILGVISNKVNCELNLKRIFYKLIRVILDINVVRVRSNSKMELR